MSSLTKKDIYEESFDPPLPWKIIEITSSRLKENVILKKEGGMFTMLFGAKELASGQSIYLKRGETIHGVTPKIDILIEEGMLARGIKTMLKRAFIL